MEGRLEEGKSTWKIGSILQVCNVSKIHEGAYVCEGEIGACVCEGEIAACVCKGEIGAYTGECSTSYASCARKSNKIILFLKLYTSLDPGVHN